MWRMFEVRRDLVAALQPEWAYPGGRSRPALQEKRGLRFLADRVLSAGSAAPAKPVRESRSRRLPQTATRPLITCLEGGQRVMRG
jgi:hypothetical protein